MRGRYASTAAAAIGGGLVAAGAQGAWLVGRSSEAYGLGELLPALGSEAALAALLILAPLGLCAWRWPGYKREWVLAAALGGVLAALGVWRAPPGASGPAVGAGPAAGPTTIVLVTGDTLRRDFVSAWPGAGASTPSLEALARDGVRFDEVMAVAPLTLPSHTSMLTGQLPAVHGVLNNGLILEGTPTSAPALLAAGGYRTGAFVSSSVLHGAHGLARFFQTYRDDISARPGGGALLLGSARSRSGRDGPVRKERGARTVERALRWLGGLGPQTPAFVWVHLYDAHGPHEPAEPTGFGDLPHPCDYEDHPSQLWRSSQALGMEADRRCRERSWAHLEGQVAAYRRDVQILDANVGELVAGLKALGRWDDAALLFSGDHGESLTEHQQWMEHQRSLYQTTLQVPLILRLPSARPRPLPAGSTVNAPVSTARIGDTLLALAGLSARLGGLDLLRIAQGAPPDLSERVAINFAPGLTAKGRAGLALHAAVVLDGRKSLVSEGGRHERYVLADDPREQRPLVRPEEATAMAEDLRGLEDTMRGPRPITELPSLMRQGTLGGGVPGRADLDPAALGTPMDPEQEEAFAAVDAAAQSALEAAMARWARRGGEADRVDPALPADVKEALEALGYVQ